MLSSNLRRTSQLPPDAEPHGRERQTTMHFRRTSSVQAALVVALAIGVPVTAGAQAPAAGGQGAQGARGRGAGGAGDPAGAQGRGRGRGADPNAGAPYTPAAGARDLRAVLFNWMWYQGML